MIRIKIASESILLVQGKHVKAELMFKDIRAMQRQPKELIFQQQTRTKTQLAEMALNGYWLTCEPFVHVQLPTDWYTFEERLRSSMQNYANGTMYPYTLVVEVGGKRRYLKLCLDSLLFLKKSIKMEIPYSRVLNIKEEDGVCIIHFVQEDSVTKLSVKPLGISATALQASLKQTIHFFLRKTVDCK